MKNDKSLVPHLAFPPTLLAVGFLLAGCHYKALQGEKVSHSDLGMYRGGMAPCSTHPHPLPHIPHTHTHTHTHSCTLHKTLTQSCTNAEGDVMSKEEEAM